MNKDDWSAAGGGGGGPEVPRVALLPRAEYDALVRAVRELGHEVHRLAGNMTPETRALLARVSKW